MITYYCPNCWREISNLSQVCPSCSYLLEAYSHLSLEEKLLMSLHHPARDSRMMAVVILGNLGSVKALPEFESIIDDDAGDIYLLREVIKVLPKIKYPKSAELLEKACTHSSPLIRRLAEEQLKKIDIR